MTRFAAALLLATLAFAHGEHGSEEHFDADAGFAERHVSSSSRAGDAAFRYPLSLNLRT
jgi:hypothetical protein